MKARLGLLAAAAIALLIMIGLGAWQLQRAAWKSELLAAIAAAEARPGVPLPAAPTQFQKVRLDGRLRPDLAALYGAEGRTTAAGTAMGAQLLVPLERDSGPPVLILLGWVPVPRPAAPAGPATIEGYVRLPDRPGPFSATDDAPGRWFHTLDPAAIGAALGLREVAPFTVVALGPAIPGRYPAPAAHLPRPADNHMQYAFTWFGLALTLVGVLAAYLRKGRRA